MMLLEGTMVHFELQPSVDDLQNLAEKFWRDSGEKWQKAEEAAFEAGKAIRNGNFSLANLTAILKWKSPRSVHHLDGNSPDQINAALEKAASPDISTKDAMEALMKLRGVAVPVASAILTTIFPERYTVIDFRALEALGHPLISVEFYEDYLAFCRKLADSGIIRPQGDLPAPTTLRALDRALWQWSKNGPENS
jgi:hypothetical protein